MEGELYYQDLNLLPTQDVSLNFLMSKVMSVIHLVCVESERAFGVVNIGIGFPKYDKEKRSLGSVVRLFAVNSDILLNSSSDRRLCRFEDYIQKGEVRLVPSTSCRYVQYRRIQIKNKERIVRRYAKRHHANKEYVQKIYESCRNYSVDLPFVMMDSLSSGHRFSLFIDEVLQDKNFNTLSFNSYGLTKSGTLPYF